MEEERRKEQRMVEQNEQREISKLEQSMKKKMSVWDLQSIHKEAKTYSAATFLQVMEKHFDPESGRLCSMTLSDGACVSPYDDKAAENLNRFNRFDLFIIEEATMKGSKLVIDQIDHIQITRQNGTPIKLCGPILGEEISKLKKLGEDALNLWGMKFNPGQKVNFHCKRKAAAALDASILATDSVIEEVGASSGAPAHQLQPQPEAHQRSKRALLLQQCPVCIRTFTEMQSMLEHCSNDHV